ncbi:MAG: XdhC family protein [Bacteroidales bacterium]
MIWKFIQKKVEQNNKIILIVVAESQGSSPGKVGFKMAVSSDGAINGSIGGGVMEYRLVELARENLRHPANAPFLKRQVHQHDAPEDKSGMVCSGEQTNIFIPVGIDNRTTINGIIKMLNEGGNGILVVNRDGFRFETAKISPDKGTATFLQNSDGWQYSECLGFKETVYIFGAGHISLPLSQILGLLDFRVEVFDNRKELSTFEANTFTHRKRIVDYNDVGNLVPEDGNSYVVIMTFGHKFDEVVLRQFLPKKLKYLGMIGSKSKVKTIFGELMNGGFTRDQVEKICSPIGLSIGSNTPAEIAVSIAAEIIQKRYS